MQGEDSVVECTNQNGAIALHTSWNSGKLNTRYMMVSVVYYAALRLGALLY